MENSHLEISGLIKFSRNCSEPLVKELNDEIMGLKGAPSRCNFTIPKPFLRDSIGSIFLLSISIKKIRIPK